MKLPQLFLLIFSIGHLSLTATGQSKEKYAKAKIWLTQTNTIKKLAGLGLETDHGQHKTNTWLISDFSEKEIDRIKQAGFGLEILIPDVQADFVNRNSENVVESTQNLVYADFCRKVKSWKVPSHWRLGSMGGHLRYDEMEKHLDSMKILYPNLISAKSPIDTTKTIEGRRIWYVKISDNAEEDDTTEPKALYSAIHHAREPVGMHQLIMYMWYLLENYSGNQDIKALVDASEMYFVPCLNPDGYLFNQTQNPEGGGMWRKNRRNNGGSFGVDLNRNYGYQWGYDDFGSSPNPEWETFRGEGPFSEPETRAMKAFCERFPFKAALNYHTYSNLLIHPWGFQDTPCEDSILFRYLGRELTKENNYRMGTGMQVLNYNTNGGSDDYMYAAVPEKGKIISMTPEVGSWFWPTANEIKDLCVENLHQNLGLAYSLHPWAIFSDTTGVFLNNKNFPEEGQYRIRFKIRRIGTNYEPATISLNFKPIGPNADQFSPITKNYTALPFNKEMVDSVLVTSLNPDLLGQPVPVSWMVSISNGIFSQYDTITHFAGRPIIETTMTEPCESSAAWTGSWVFATDDFLEGTACLKPTFGNYASDMHTTMRRIRPFDLRPTHIKSAEMSMWTKMEIEKNFDYAALEFSIDSGATWEKVCTDKSVMSSPFSQQAGNIVIPIWDGFQYNWQRETVNLQPYLGQKLWIRFIFHSDDFQEFDGFRVDHVEVKTNADLTAGKKNFYKPQPKISLMPNPAKDQFMLQLEGWEGTANLKIADALGREVFEANRLMNGKKSFDVKLPKGIYSVFVKDKYQNAKVLRLMVE